MKFKIPYLFFAVVIALFSFSCKTKKEATTTAKSNLSEKDKMEFTFYFYEGIKSKSLGNIDEAVVYFKKCIDKDATDGAPQYEIAQLLYSKRDFQNALIYAKQAVTADEKNQWYNQIYAECLFRNNKLAESAKVYEKLIEQDPAHINYYYSLANAYIYLDKFDESIKTYDKLEKRFGVSEEVSIQKQRIYLKLNKFDKAEDEIQKLITDNPKELRYYNILADMYLTNGYKDKALLAFNKILEVDSLNGFAHLSLSDYYKEIGDAQKSLSEMKMAFKSSDVDIDTKMKVMLGYYSVSENSEEKKKEAYELLDLLVSNNLNEAKAYSMEGDFLYRDKKLKEAKQSYLKAVELDKSKFPIWYQVLIIDSELSDYTSMKKVSADAIELFPNQPGLYLLSGISNLQTNNTQKAIEDLKTGLAFVYDNKELQGQFYSNLGDAYNRIKDFKLSDEAYDNALRLNPNDIYVLNNYSYYLSLRKEKLELAEKMSKKTVELEPNNSSYLDTYGWILYVNQNYTEAKIYIEKAINAGAEKNAVILEHYGDVLYKLNDTENALLYWNKALQAGKGSEFLETKIKEKKLIE
ncbi:MAG: tetratricopeptide repeat protein [Bacteroidota bacterium]